MKSGLLPEMAAILKVDEVRQFGTKRDEAVFVLRLGKKFLNVSVPLVDSVNAMTKVLFDAAELLRSTAARELSDEFVSKFVSDWKPLTLSDADRLAAGWVDYTVKETSKALGVSGDLLKQEPAREPLNRFSAIAEELKEAT